MGRPGSPTITGRFQEGRSGNPKGRPRAPKETQASAFDIVIDRKLTVTQDGVPRELTIEEALQQRIYHAAIGGSRSAQREVLKMIAKREKALAAKGGRNLRRVITRVEPVDPANADAALQILGIATRDTRPDRRDKGRKPLLLEPWVVQAGLSRRRGGDRLGDMEVKEIEHSTRDAERLRWPRKSEE